MTSFSTGTSAVGKDVDKVAEATRIVREREPGLAVDGPLQYDAAAVWRLPRSNRARIAVPPEPPLASARRLARPDWRPPTSADPRVRAVEWGPTR
jgi:hypothetical protein